MKSINRIAIAVKPRDPYLAWARAIDDRAASFELSVDEFASIYLVEATDAFESEQLIRKHYAAIFEKQLNAWHRDAAKWPNRRTEAMFREWFDSKVVEMIWDLGRSQIITED